MTFDVNCCLLVYFCYLSPASPGLGNYKTRSKHYNQTKMGKKITYDFLSAIKQATECLKLSFFFCLLVIVFLWFLFSFSC